MASPIINFVSISGRSVSAQYENLPEGSQVVVVNSTSGKALAEPVIPATGSGSLAIELPAEVRSGAYYLQAQNSAGAYLARSVVFYVA